MTRSPPWPARCMVRSSPRSAWREATLLPNRITPAVSLARSRRRSQAGSRAPSNEETISCPTWTRSGSLAAAGCSGLACPPPSSPPSAPAITPAMVASSATATSAAKRRRAAGSLLRYAVLPRAPRLHRLADLLDGLGQALLHPLQVPAGERDDPHRALGDHGGAAAVLLEQAHLTEEVAGTQVRDVLAVAQHLGLPLLDRHELVRVVAL